MSSFRATPTPIPEAFILERTRREDSRGFLERLGDTREIDDANAGFEIRQVNRTFTRQTGTVRGFHLQLPPSAEVKIVTCLQGEVFDVIVDLRGESPTFGEWWGVSLTGVGVESVLVPKGCAHGLQTLTPNVQMLYQHSAAHDREGEAGLNPLDSELAVEWPLPIIELSLRDREETRTLDFFRSVRW